MIISTFRYSIKNDTTKKITKTVEPRFDEDGDLILDNNEDETVKVEHKIQTNLTDVGFQIWRGAFFMADFALQNKFFFQDKTVLEIGAGTGITSIVMSKHCQCKEIVVTDIALIQESLKNNLKRNNAVAGISADILDLNHFETSDAIYSKVTSEVDVVFGADIIYDNDITDGIIKFLEILLKSSHSDDKTLYFAIDKRYIFTLDVLDAIAPAYEYFMAKLDEFCVTKEIKILEYYPEEIDQAFCYERSKDLVLIAIQIENREGQ